MGALIFVAIALGLIVSAQKKKGLAALVDQDEQAKAIFNVIDGRLVYKPTMRKLIIDSLFSRVVQLTNEPSLLMLVPGTGDRVVAATLGSQPAGGDVELARQQLILEQLQRRRGRQARVRGQGRPGVQTHLRGSGLAQEALELLLDDLDAARTHIEEASGARAPIL